MVGTFSKILWDFPLNLIITDYSRDPNNRACTIIDFWQIFHPTLPYQDPTRSLIFEISVGKKRRIFGSFLRNFFSKIKISQKFFRCSRIHSVLKILSSKVLNLKRSFWEYVQAKQYFSVYTIIRNLFIPTRLLILEFFPTYTIIRAYTIIRVLRVSS